MTDREKEILNILKNEPMISQQDLADRLSITRSSAAVHITNLMKKGFIKGKGYILNHGNHITVIGGSNMDIQGVPNDKLVMFDSNPGKIDMSLGGVARNIAENISRLNLNTKLISAVGNDLYGNTVLSECSKLGIDVDDCYLSNEYPTSVYISILNNKKDMEVAISHMDIIKKLDTSFISSKHQSIDNSLAIVIDTNLDKEVIDYITTKYSKIPIFVDTVSTTKCMKIKDIIGRFNTIKVNKYEAEALSNIKINSFDDIKKCSNYFLENGTKNIFITLGEEGVFSANKDASYYLEGVKVKTVSATGAGDAFMAALVYSYINNYNLIDTASFSMSASILALSHKDTINPSMSVEKINNILKEIVLC